MIGDRDVWLAATLLILRHGADAGLYAAERADELDAEVDSTGRCVWLAVLRAIDEFGRLRPRAGEAVN